MKAGTAHCQLSVHDTNRTTMGAQGRQGLPTVSCQCVTLTEQHLVHCECRDCPLSAVPVYSVIIFSFYKWKDENIQNYNLAVVLDGCETWSRILREEYALRVRRLTLRRAS